MMKTRKSQQLFQKAQKLIPGGVDSPVRAFKSVGSQPLFIQKAKGCWLTDVDGNKYIDYVGSWGPMILGHAHPRVLKAITQTAKNGTSFGAPCELEVKLAEEIIRAVPSIEKVRFVNSGTEAVMSAVRVARGFMKRKKIIKFDGCYHGHADYLLVKAGSGAATLGTPDSAGVPEEFVQLTLIARFNDLGSVEEIFKNNSGEIAAILIEPVVGNMGVIVPEPGFLEGLRKICDLEKSLLIFDEVMTGFRVSYGGAQQLYKVKPDLTTLGKIIGGGLPVGAYGGRKEIMDLVAPMGPVYQAGTLSGNPIAMAAGLETLRLLKELKPYRTINTHAKVLAEGLRDAAEKNGVSVQVQSVGSMLTLFFADKMIKNADDARACRTADFARFFQSMLQQGVYLAPSQFEACFLSLSHTERVIERTIDAARTAFKQFRVS